MKETKIFLEKDTMAGKIHKNEIIAKSDLIKYIRPYHDILSEAFSLGATEVEIKFINDRAFIKFQICGVLMTSIKYVDAGSVLEFIGMVKSAETLFKSINKKQIRSYTLSKGFTVELKTTTTLMAIGEQLVLTFLH